MKAKSARGASTRQRILESAAKLMYRNGVNGTSVDDVLCASSTGKSQFYHYFASKEALVKELIHFHVAALPAAQESLLTNLGSVAGIETWLDCIVFDSERGLYIDGCPIGNLASELSGQSEDLRADLQSTFAHWEMCLTNGLKAMQGSGVLRASVVPEALAMFCVAAIEGGLLLAKTQKSSAPLVATIGQVKVHLRSQTLGASKRSSEPRRRPKPRPLSFCP